MYGALRAAMGTTIPASNSALAAVGVRWTDNAHKRAAPWRSAKGAWQRQVRAAVNCCDGRGMQAGPKPGGSSGSRWACTLTADDSFSPPPVVRGYRTCERVVERLSVFAVCAMPVDIAEKHPAGGLSPRDAATPPAAQGVGWMRAAAPRACNRPGR